MRDMLWNPKVRIAHQKSEDTINKSQNPWQQVLREFNHVNPQDDDEGKVFADTRNLLYLNVAACYLKFGECRKSIETCNKVLEANPAHVKGLYRRGMAYMGNGDFDEARADFKMMIKVDKSTESDATAALLKLKQKEQEVEKKARKQFKGLFDKKPGEIAEVKANEDEGQVTSESQKDGAVQGDSSDETNSEDSHEDAPLIADRRGWFSYFWPTGSRIFSSLGLQRCTIL
ncbi:peptidyl-prolyl cis-trans isomerase pasticcino1-like protein [Trifolium pratense]|uniref:Peptidyl-prolyl cis-trans isomerase pasticcino1-like protein n=2 Tax=Trifolium pratense TaxID=57577 RepID=A0A2K3KYI9_TRIPR|nr:peptidyl-prolyl cis-trans isomerase pasticcino1-like protein [Trifolium pratense]